MALGSTRFPAFNDQIALGQGNVEFVGLTSNDIQSLGLSRGGKQLVSWDKKRGRGMVVKYKDIQEIFQPITDMITRDTKFEIESVREKITITQYLEEIIKKYSP